MLHADGKARLPSGIWVDRSAYGRFGSQMRKTLPFMTSHFKYYMVTKVLGEDHCHLVPIRVVEGNIEAYRAFTLVGSDRGEVVGYLAGDDFAHLSCGQFVKKPIELKIP